MKMKLMIAMGLVALAGQVTAQTIVNGMIAIETKKTEKELLNTPPFEPDVVPAQSFVTTMNIAIYGRYANVYQCLAGSYPGGAGCWSEQAPRNGDRCGLWFHTFELTWVPYGSYWCPPANISYTYWLGGDSFQPVQVASWTAVPHGTCNGRYTALGAEVVANPNCPWHPPGQPDTK